MGYRVIREYLEERVTWNNLWNEYVPAGMVCTMRVIIAKCGSLDSARKRLKEELQSNRDAKQYIWDTGSGWHYYIEKVRNKSKKQL